MILENKGFKYKGYYIPPFKLTEGEFIGIDFCNVEYNGHMILELANIFSDATSNSKVKIHKPLTFVKHYKESWFRRKFNRITVEQYLKENCKTGTREYNEIYKITNAKPKSKMVYLEGSPRKLTSLFCTLSKTNNIIFDTLALSPMGNNIAIKYVNEAVIKGGAAIFLGSSEDLKTIGVKSYKIELIK